jgi:glycerol uptake facilitator-like aquaporin
MTLLRRIVAEALGTAFLLAAVVGSGMMGQRLSGGNVAIALLANTLATGATLVTLIFTFGPISGAHFNPAVTLADASQGGISWSDAPAYIGGQVLGAFIGVGTAHLMFGEVLIQVSQHARTDGGQLFSEFVATFGLLCVIWGCARLRAEAVPIAVGLYITGAYWFTASTSFAKSGGNACTSVHRYVCRDSTLRCTGPYGSAVARRFRCDFSFLLACALASFQSERCGASTCACRRRE